MKCGSGMAAWGGGTGGCGRVRHALSLARPPVFSRNVSTPAFRLEPARLKRRERVYEVSRPATTAQTILRNANAEIDRIREVPRAISVVAGGGRQANAAPENVVRARHVLL